MTNDCKHKKLVNTQAWPLQDGTSLIRLKCSVCKALCYVRVVRGFRDEPKSNEEVKG